MLHCAILQNKYDIKNMRKSVFYPAVVAFILTTAFFRGCTADITTLPIAVVMNQSSALLIPGETMTLTATVIPDDAAIKTLTWNSSDPSIAEVNDGVVTAISEGLTVITATTNSGQKTGNCVLTVAYPVTSVSFNKASAILPVGRSLRLIANVTPDDAPDKSLIWESGNPNIATVENGVVSAKNVGTTSITVTTVVGNRTAIFRLTVISQYYKIMNMTVNPYGSVWFSVLGTGFMYIDWDDGSTYNSYGIYMNTSDISHIYRDYTTRNVSIFSENIINFFFHDMKSLYRVNLKDLDISDHPTLAFLDCDNTQLNSLNISGCTALRGLYCRFNQLSAEALNEIFRSLPEQGGNIFIYGNPGADTCDKSIATEKGWRFFD